MPPLLAPLGQTLLADPRPLSLLISRLSPKHSMSSLNSTYQKRPTISRQEPLSPRLRHRVNLIVSLPPWPARVFLRFRAFFRETRLGPCTRHPLLL